MSNFSDREDGDIVRLAKAYEDKGVNVSWAQVAQKMKYSKKSAHSLKQRLTTLKATHGKVIRNFPPRFFTPWDRARKLHAVGRCKTVRSRCELLTSTKLPTPSVPVHSPGVNQVRPQVHQHSLLAFNLLFTDAHEYNRAQSAATTITDTPVLSKQASHDALTDMFSLVRRSDVRQLAGRTDQNVGEISLLGVTALIQAIQFTCSDVFVDVGSGIGNVIAQVALESCAKQAIGVEVRSDIARLGQRLMDVAREASLPRLAATTVIVGDIRDVMQDLGGVANATVLFSNNFLFSPRSNLALHSICCTLPNLRMVLFSAEVCTRHSLRCTNEFCTVWQLRKKIEVPTEFRVAFLQLSVYERK